MWEQKRLRGRAAASLVATAALVGTATAVTTSPALSDPPLDNTCNEAYPVDQLVKGDAVTGLTVTGVTSGTAPVQFDGEVIGVLEEAIAPGLDMVMARIDVAGMDIPEVGGIWQGMSGSPVYAPDGRLIGAIAYGLTYASSNVAGITPYEEMGQHLPGSAAARVDVSSADARLIARSSGVPRSEAAEGFSRLKVPQRVFASLTEPRLKRLLGDGARYDKFDSTRYLNKKLGGFGGKVAAASSAPTDLVAGGNLAATMSYGTVTTGGIGTVTAVCDAHLVGFGHPATFLGDTSLTLHPADALYVQGGGDSIPFKVANFGAPAGTIDGDHLAGISGFVGDEPDTTAISSHVTWTPTGAQRPGESFVSVPSASASTTFYQHLTMHDRVLDAISAGSEVLTWDISGTDEAGEPFSLSFTDAYASDFDIAYESSWELADLVYFLSSFPGVTLESVASTSVVSDDASTYRITRMEQRRGGEWVKLTRRQGAVVDAGDTLVLRASMATASGETNTETMSLKVPKAARKRGFVYLEGGGYSYLDVWSAEDVDDIEKVVAEGVRGDEVQAVLYVRGGDQRRIRTHSDPTGKVVVGGRYAEVRIRR